jgi:double-stranded uracil-DNA glycosylase
LASDAPFKPTKEELQRALDRRIPDLIAPNLDVLFSGINPGLYSGATRKHFARPGNRFWKALHGAGFTDRVLSPFEQEEMLVRGLGITNIVNRTTVAAADLTDEEVRRGGRSLRRKILKYEPRFFALLGVGAYRTGFDRPKATVGPQDETIGETKIWVLPNPSGLNANYQLPKLIEVFAELREAVGSKR